MVNVPVPALWSAPPLSMSAILTPSLLPVPPRVSPPPPQVVLVLDRADRAFLAGEYDTAVQVYESYLNLTLSARDRDHALFRLGLAYILREKPTADWQRAAAAFQQLGGEYPQSSLNILASLLLVLRSEVERLGADARQKDIYIQQLRKELDRLKNIDTGRRSLP